MTELRAGRSIRGNRDTYLVEQVVGAGNCGQTYRAARGSETLAAAIADGHSFEAVELTEVFRSLLESLRYLHTLSPPVFHRNLGPESIILADDRPKLADLGLVASGPCDARDDLFQLASVIFFAATHRQLDEIVTRRGVVDLDKLAPNLEPQLRRALAAALDPVRDRRPASAAALLAMLDEWRFSPRAIVRAAGGRRPRLRAALGAATVLVMGVGARVALSRAAVDEEFESLAESDAGPDIEIEATKRPGASDCPSLPEPADDAPLYTRSNPLPMLTWRLPVLESRGFDVPKECLLELDAQERDGEAVDCTATLRCGTDTLSYQSEPRACRLAQGSLTEERAAYHLWFVSDERPGESLIADGDRGRVVWKSRSAWGEATVVMKLGSSESAKRSDIQLQSGGLSSVRTGIVSDVEGSAPVHVGQRCALSVASASRGRRTCQVEVRCGQQTLYAQSGVCDGADGAPPEAFTDEMPSIIDGTPTLAVLDRRVLVEDVSVDGASTIEITLPKSSP